MRIGNMKGGEEVTVHIGMVVTLEYDPGCWKLSIPATYTEALIDIHLGYKWELEAVITSNTRILGVHSTRHIDSTHHVDEDTLTGNESCVTMKMSGNDSLQKDIEIRYRTEEVEKPRVEVVENKETGDLAAVVSFFPVVNSGGEDIGDRGVIGDRGDRGDKGDKRDIEDKEEKKEGSMGTIIPSKSIICKDKSEILKIKSSTSSQAISLGEYIIVLDCSGSMSGSRISLAKSACQLFIRSLPVGCLFNIYLFGSSYDTLFGTSKEYTESTMQQALNYIEGTGADLGGTDLASPLRSIYSTKVVPKYPKSLFILTDGDVLNPEEVFNLVTKNVGTTRVHTLGISSSASKYLVKQCGLKGKGSYHFVTNIKNLGSEVIHTLGVAMRPSLSGLKLHIPDGYKVKYSHPQVDQLLDIRTHEPFIFYAILERDINIDNIYTGGERPKFILSGDTQTQTLYEYCVDIETCNPKSEDYIENIPKLAMKEIITHGKGLTKKEILELSLKYGVLSEESAFFLEERCKGGENILRPMKVIKGNFAIAQEPGHHIYNNMSTLYTPGTAYRNTSLNFHGGFGSQRMGNITLECSRLANTAIIPRGGGRGGGGVRGGRDIPMMMMCQQVMKPPTMCSIKMGCLQEDVEDYDDQVADYSNSDLRSHSHIKERERSRSRDKARRNIPRSSRRNRSRSRSRSLSPGAGGQSLSQSKIPSFEKLLKLQNFDGSWGSIKTILKQFPQFHKFKDIPKNILDMKSLEEGEKEAIYATVLAIYIMNNLFFKDRSEWKIIESKANNWLKGKKVKYEDYVGLFGNK